MYGMTSLSNFLSMTSPCPTVSDVRTVDCMLTYVRRRRDGFGVGAVLNAKWRSPVEELIVGCRRRDRRDVNKLSLSDQYRVVITSYISRQTAEAAAVAAAAAATASSSSGSSRGGSSRSSSSQRRQRQRRQQQQWRQRQQ